MPRLWKTHPGGSRRKRRTLLQDALNGFLDLRRVSYYLLNRDCRRNAFAALPILQREPVNLARGWGRLIRHSIRSGSWNLPSLEFWPSSLLSKVTEWHAIGDGPSKCLYEPGLLASMSADCSTLWLCVFNYGVLGSSARRLTPFPA
jgi:hypothetical protein